EDKILAKKFRDAVMAIQMEFCGACHERWFDLKVENGKCTKCRKGKTQTKFQDSNHMNPGPLPGADILPPLTQIEEMLIAPVHALVSLYQIRG
ncbi:hypothetical protein C8R45DRAFT_774122, partial [Mycena sanguinolenta]